MTKTSPQNQDLAKAFDPAAIEQRWYTVWENSGYFAAGYDTDKKDNFCILLPPPNVTGTLHMGHGFNQTLMDALCRYHRMRGANTLWQPGVDHAGIATQMVVERQLEQDDTSRHDIGREAFLQKVWQWKRYSGGAITRQMRRMGASCDWSRERFTMDDELSQTVRETFVRLYREGLVYRGKRLVNWDPFLHTALSDLEVVNEEESGFMWHIRYPLANGSGHLTVATTRPETMLGDTAVMVHPEDGRYTHLIGENVILPLCEREIPIIADAYVDRQFGTGCVKVTPAHDFNDYAVGQRHNLPIINVLTPDASINEAAPPTYQGMDRIAAREQIVIDLKAADLLEKVDKHSMKVPRGDRSGVVLEPMLTDQWFVATSKAGAEGKSIAELALECVANGEIKFFPENWSNTYNQWLNNIQDWCISRQLWWGHQIPAWYAAEDGDRTAERRLWVAHDKEEAYVLAAADGYQGELEQDEDVLDTWYSSALWPFSTLGWTHKWPQQSNPAIDLYLPSSVLVTGFDIIFFWVARMVMMSKYITGKIPFRHVYVHGLIRDVDGQKMSKSKGNVLDPIDLVDGIELDDLLEKRTSGLMDPKQAASIIQKTREEYPQGIPAFGVDALRFTFASLASPGRDIKFDMHRCEGYKNFCNKLWNASRFVLMRCQGHDLALGHQQQQGGICSTAGGEPRLLFSFADRWIVSRLQRVEAEVEKHFTDYRFDLLSRAIYELVWNEYCDWYVEIAKVQITEGGEAEQRATRRTLVRVLETILRLAHPLIPFISEELWQIVAPVAGRKSANDNASIMQAPYPQSDSARIDTKSEARMARLQALVNSCRNLRGEMGLSPAQRVPLLVAASSGAEEHLTPEALEEVDKLTPILMGLCRLSEVQTVKSLPTKQLVPVALTEGLSLCLQVEIDRQAESERLQKEIDRWQIQVVTSQQKLDNDKFIARAPAAVVEQEKNRLTTARQTLSELLLQLERMQ